MACSLDRHPGAKNWIERVGGLPNYICEIAKDILDSPGSTNDVSRAIAIAVSRVKVWAAGGGGVKADTRAKAEKAAAEWEAKKARSHASVKASSIDDDVVELTAIEVLEADLAASHVRDRKPKKTLDELIVQLAAGKADGPYGKVTYADPKNKKYPIDTKAHAKAAWSYINQADNAAKYPMNGVTLSSVKSAIRAACKKFGVNINEY